MGRIVGIDLGTTNSAVAVWGKKGPELVPAAGGSRLTPSVVGFGEDEEVIIGAAARSRASANADQTIYSAKRFIGRSFAAATADREDVPYEVVEGEHGEACILVDGMPLPPEQISAVVLRELKRCAEEYLKEEVDGAVITAPAHFNDAQRAATRKAAGLAGLEVRRILNEPTAAALAYGLDKVVEGEKLVAVYDFGGGTFDVSVLSIGEDILEVLATRGDPHLGGDMIDSRLAAWLLKRFEEETGTPVDEDAVALKLLGEAAERAKITLSEADTAEVRLSFPHDADKQDTPVPELNATLTRVVFNDMVEELVDRTLACCDQVLADAGKQADEIDEIVLAGGSTRIPLVRKRVEKYFGKKPHHSLDPDEIVAMGAAVQAGIIAGEVKGVILVDVTSLSLGIETHEGRASVVIPRNTSLPVTATRTFTTSTDDQTAVQFHVVQGESERADENDSLGRFILDGLPPAKAGTPQIEVTFAIDVNGMVLVSARDPATGVEQTVTVSVATVSGRSPSRQPSRSGAGAGTAKTGGPAGAKDSAKDEGAPEPVRQLLAEADGLLALAGEKLTRVDRASLMKNVKLLRTAVADAVDEESVEKTRQALAKVVTRVKKAKPARRRI